MCTCNINAIMLTILNITSLHSNSKVIQEIPNENLPFISMNKYVYKYDVCYMFYHKEMIYPDTRPPSERPKFIFSKYIAYGLRNGFLVYLCLLPRSCILRIDYCDERLVY